MNKQQLASLIWDTCNDMRGSISAVEYKDIILGFIFYRFVSENEVSYLKKQDWTMEIMAEELTEKDSKTVQQCKDHLGYFIAYKDLFSTWKDHTATFTVSDVTDALNAFVRNIGSNPDHQKLFNEIFKSLSEKLSKMGSISNQTSHIKNIIKIVSRIPMDENQGYDVLGFIYEFLLKNFASNSKKDEFYTPHEISILMSEIVAHHLRDREQINILDPTSGSGSLLINIGQSVQKYLQDSGNITYYAQELIQETFNLTRMNLVMRGISPSNIKVRRGDTLANDWPYFDDNDENSYEYVPVDCVVSNPPYSHKWDADNHTNDPRYKEYGIAPSRIHIDPLVEMLCTSENGIETNIEVISTVREKYPSIHITAAISNISFNLPVRKLINLGFVVLAMNAGLDSGILDPTNRDMLGLIYATEALLGEDDYCMEYIGAYREGLIGPVK